jgi:hypothetical protein
MYEVCLLIGSGVTARLIKSIVRPLREEFKSVISRLERHSKIVDQTAVATELVRSADFRAGKLHAFRYCRAFLLTHSVRNVKEGARKSENSS